MSAQYINSRRLFLPVAARLRQATRFALDTEFVGEETYTPRLELIQVNDGQQIYIFDYPAIGELGPLGEALLDPAIEKVMHAASQDVAIFYQLLGQPPAHIFDTQIAAAMVGYGAQVAYSTLVQRITHHHLAKAETFSNWSQRPLTSAQLAYAEEDVRDLLVIADHLKERLHALDRMDWAVEEMRRAFAPEKFTPPADRERFRRVRDRSKLSRRGLAILRELAAWREAEARRRDVPRSRIAPDDILVEIARLAPRSLVGLRGLRRTSPQLIDRYGEEILEAVRQGLAVPDRDLPSEHVAPRRELPPGLVDLLQAILHARAGEAEIAPAILASTSDLHTLVEMYLAGNAEEHPVMQGWRRRLVGADLAALLAGRTGVTVAPDSLRIRVTDHSPVEGR